MWCRPAKSWGATQHRCPPAPPFGPCNGRFCSAETKIRLPLKNSKTSPRRHPSGRVLLLNVYCFSSVKEAGTAGISPSQEISPTRPLSVLQGGLKMARKGGGESLPHSPLPLRPRPGRCRAASRRRVTERVTERAEPGLPPRKARPRRAGLG